MLPASRTIYLLKRVEIMLRNALEGALAGTDISVAQYVVLSLLKTMPEASSADLSRRAGVTPQTMWETVAAFEKAGFILRKQSPEHKRIRTISLTPAGHEKLAACDVQVDALEASLLGDLPPTEIDTLRNSLRAILKAGNVWEPDHKERTDHEL